MSKNHTKHFKLRHHNETLMGILPEKPWDPPLPASFFPGQRIGLAGTSRMGVFSTLALALRVLVSKPVVVATGNLVNKM